MDDMRIDELVIKGREAAAKLVSELADDVNDMSRTRGLTDEQKRQGEALLRSTHAAAGHVLNALSDEGKS